MATWITSLKAVGKREQRGCRELLREAWESGAAPESLAVMLIATRPPGAGCAGAEMAIIILAGHGGRQYEALHGKSPDCQSGTIVQGLKVTGITICAWTLMWFELCASKRRERSYDQRCIVI